MDAVSGKAPGLHASGRHFYADAAFDRVQKIKISDFQKNLQRNTRFIVTVLGYSLNDLVDVHRAEIPPELALELSDFFTACTMDERTSIVRIFREMLNMIRTLRKTSP